MSNFFNPPVILCTGGFFMDFKKVFDVINKYNIDKNDVLELVEEAKQSIYLMRIISDM